MFQRKKAENAVAIWVRFSVAAARSTARVKFWTRVACGLHQTSSRCRSYGGCDQRRRATGLRVPPPWLAQPASVPEHDRQTERRPWRLESHHLTMAFAASRRKASDPPLRDRRHDQVAVHVDTVLRPDQAYDLGF